MQANAVPAPQTAIQGAVPVPPSNNEEEPNVNSGKESAIKLSNVNQKIFYVQTAHYRAGNYAPLNILTRGPFSYTDIIDMSKTKLIVSGIQPNSSLVKTSIMYPKISEESINVLDICLIDIKSPTISQTLIKSIMDFSSSEHAQMYVNQMENISIKAMTDKEREEYESKSEVKNFDEWITQNVNTIFTLPQNSESLKLHFETKLDFIGYLLTTELGFFIANEMKNTTLAPSTQWVKAWQGDVEGTEKFKDIIQAIEHTGNPVYMFYYKTYHLLKSLCFVLHDKPVDRFAPLLYKTMNDRFLLQMQDYKSAYSFIDVIFTRLWEIWRQGFDVTIQETLIEGKRVATGMEGKVTQSRCHKTIANLTTEFNNNMTSYGINVPKKIVTFSVPYSSFEFEKTQKDLKSTLNFYQYGLSDAVGNRKYIQDLDKGAIYPNTCAQQDAAPNEKKGTTLEVTEDTSKQAGNPVVDHKYKITQKGIQNEAHFQIEPQRFGDISIYCRQQKHGNPYFLYYAAFRYFDSVVQKIISDGGLTIFNLSFGMVSIPSDLYHIKDEGVDKILFAVITDRISQNETIPLINTLIPTMQESARGKKTFTLKSLMYKMNILRTSDNNRSLQDAVCILLATFAKELGDQSKIQVIENICRNSEGSLKSYVATVDSFFSESIVNGGVLFKGGNLIFTEQSGFHALTQEEIDIRFEIMYRASKYTYSKFESRVKMLSDIIKNVCTNALSTPDARLTFTTYLIYSAILNNVDTNKIIVNGTTYDAFINKFDRANHSSIFDEESLVKRLFTYGNSGNITDIFAIYENHTNDPFSMTIVDNIRRTTLWDMIIDYKKRDYNIGILFEETPLFFLIEEIPRLKKIIFKKNRGTSGDLTAGVIEILEQKFIDKMQTFINKFSITVSPFPINAHDLFVILFACNPNVNAVHNNSIPYEVFKPLVSQKIIVFKSELAKLSVQDESVGAYVLLQINNNIGLLPQLVTPDEPKYNDVDSQQDLETDNQVSSDPSDVAFVKDLAASIAPQSGGVKLPNSVFRKGRIDFPSYKKFLIEHFSRPVRKTRKQRRQQNNKSKSRRNKSNKSKRKSLKKRK